MLQRMLAARTWWVVPVAGVGCGALVAARDGWIAAAACAVLAAAVAATVRSFGGASVGVAAAAASAAVLATAIVLVGGNVSARDAVAAACGMFVVAELARPQAVDSSPWPALGGAWLASALAPAFVALIPIAGVRWVRGPWPRPRAAIAMPIAGGVLIAAALACYALRPSWWAAWSHHAVHRIGLVQYAETLGDALGPAGVVAAIAGLAIAVRAGRTIAVAIVALAVGAIANDLMAGTIGAPIAALTAVSAGVAVARLAAIVRIPSGQPVVSACVGALVVATPALLLI